MKGYTFVRSNVPKVIYDQNEKETDDKKEKRVKPVDLPEISQFVYYLFAPTLVYKDKYPR